jgi:lipopolysaccharide/colanic/teichoic acid biosynthesis glycosyltransferase
MGERARELLILVIGDILLFNLALWLTLLVRYLELPSMERLALHVPPFLIISAVWLVVFFIMGLYDKHTNLLKKLLVNRLIHAQSINVVVAGILFFVIPFGITPKVNLVIYLFVSILLLTIWRLGIVPNLPSARRQKAILIADGPEAVELADEINNNDRYSYYFSRIIDETTLKETDNFESKILQVIERDHIDLIVADPRGKMIKTFLPTLFDLSFLRFKLTFLDFNRLYQETFDRVPIKALEYEWFIANISQSKKTIYDALKRTIDIFGALVLLVPTAVVFPFIALAIKWEDKGTLFYKTTRIGQFDAPITIYKFRTKNGADTGSAALKSTLVDTKVGRVLRKTRLDELPQLINVLRGDLSFIGPRPEMPALAEVYAKEIPFYNTRHFLKPGLSGWAQINDHDAPRGGVDVERTTSKLSYDLYYLEQRSLVLDIQIALKTIATILLRTGS